jgi:hypothetical protein
VKAVTLAPETGVAVHAAQQALEQEASKAEAVNDPTGPTLRALSLAMGACHKLFVDGSMTIGSLIQTARQPVAPEEMRVAVAQGIRASASGAVRALNIRNILIASGILVGSNVLTAGAICRLYRRRPRSGFPCGPTGASGSRATFLRLRRGLGRSGNPTFYVESTRARPSSGLRRIFSLWRLLALEGSANRPKRPNWADVESARASGCCGSAHWLQFACGAARLPPVR